MPARAMDDGRTTAEGCAWTSLPPDLLLEIFRRLESTAVIRCASTCRPWRRTIIDNAFFIRPRLDRFLPSLLLGVFHGYRDYNHQHLYLRRTPGPGPFQSAVLPSTADGSECRIQSLIPATGGFDREMYTDLLSSRDGFILLRGRRWCSGLCLLCNLMTGDSKILPEATIKSCKYVLLTGYDDHNFSGTGNADDALAVRILAVAGTDTMCTKENRITYQVFSFTSGGDGAGVWCPVKRSMELKTGFWVPVYDPCTVVCGDAVYWLGRLAGESFITSALGLDVLTGRAWTTWLPAETHFRYYGGSIAFTPTLLATSGDGRLSVIRSLINTTGHKIKVWVLTSDDQWSLQKTIDVPVEKRVPNYQHDYFKYRRVLLNTFCPRSGCVIGRFDGQVIRIDLESSSHPCVEWIGTSRERFWYSHSHNAYEMDWSTYISRMKQF